MALGLAFGAVTDAAFLQWAILAQKLLVARHGAERFNVQLKPKFPPWPTIGVLGIVFVSMARRRPTSCARRRCCSACCCRWCWCTR